MARFFALTFLGISLLGITLTAKAQQQGGENTLLPEIDPQDIEIRSQFKARFPGVRRQPILGFEPTPRVYQVDPNRQPFMETDEQVVASVPVSQLSRPTPPQYHPLHYSPDIRLFSRAGIGSFSSPEAQLWGYHKLNSGSYAGGDLDFSSSNGHLESQPSSFRFLDANAEYATHPDDKTALHFKLNGQSDFHHLYEQEGLAPVNPELGKSYFGLGFDGDIRRNKNAVEGWSATAGVRYFEIDLEDPNLPGDINETVYKGSFSKQWAGSRTNEIMKFKLGARSGVSGPDGNQEGWTTLQGGGRYERLFNYTTQVNAGAHVYYTSNQVETNLYLGPVLEVKHSFNDELKVTGKAKGAPVLKTLENHHEYNRFMVGNTLLRHSYRFEVSGEASYEYYKGSTLQGGVRISRTTDAPIYTRPQQAGVLPLPQAQTFYQVNYANTRNFKIYGGVTHQFKAEKFWVSGRVYVQNPTIDGAERIPFRETWGVNGSVSVRLLDRFALEGWADYVGARETGTAGEDLPGFLLIGAQMDVEITKRLGAYVKGVNLLDQEYEMWKGYTERPIQFYGGVTLKLN